MSFHNWADHPLGVQEVIRVPARGNLFILADTDTWHGHPLSRPQIWRVFLAAGLAIRSQASLVPLLSITAGEKI